MAKFDQVIDRARTGLAVLDEDAVGRNALHVVVVEDHVEAGIGVLRQLLVRHAAAVHHHGIDAVRGEELQPLDDRARILIMGIGDHCPPGAPDAAAELFQETGMELAQRRHHQADHVADVRLHRRGDGVAPIAEPGNGAFDPVAIGGADGVAVDVARHGSDGDTGGLGHIDDGRVTSLAWRGLAVYRLSPPRAPNPTAPCVCSCRALEDDDRWI